MIISDYEKLLFYFKHPAEVAQGENEIFAYRINNSIILKLLPNKTQISFYIYEYSSEHKFYITILQFSSLIDFFNQLKSIDKNQILKKYLRSAGLLKRKNKLLKTSGTIKYESISNFYK